MIIISAEESDDNKVLVYIKGHEKREWLVVYSIVITRQLTLDADYEDIDCYVRISISETRGARIYWSLDSAMFTRNNGR